MALRVWRRELNPEFRSINEVEREVLALVTGGARFARVCEVLGEGEHVGDAIERAAALLACWLKDGLLVAVEQSSACEAGAITIVHRRAATGATTDMRRK
jgi:hypothetical protein